MKYSLGINICFPVVTWWSFSYMFVHDLMGDKYKVLYYKEVNQGTLFNSQPL